MRGSLAGIALFAFGIALAGCARTAEPDPQVLARWSGGEIRWEELNARILAMSPLDRLAADSDGIGWYRLQLDALFEARVRLTTDQLRELEQDPDFQSQFRARRHGLLVDEFLKRHPQPRISNEELRAHFESRRKEFDRPEKRLLHNILLEVDDRGGCDEAEQLRQRIINGESFSNLAKTYSISSSARSGGNAGVVTADRLRPDVADVVFSLEPGELSQVKRGTGGCQFFMVGNIQPAVTATLAGSRQKLMAQLAEAGREGWLSGLMKEAASLLGQELPDPAQLLSSASAVAPESDLYRIEDESVKAADLQRAVATGLPEQEAMRRLVGEVLFAAAMVRGEPDAAARLIAGERERLALEFLRHKEILDAAESLTEDQLEAYYRDRRSSFKTEAQVELELLSWPLRKGDPTLQTARAEALKQRVIDHGGISNDVWQMFAADPGIERKILPLMPIRAVVNLDPQLVPALMRDLSSEAAIGPYVRNGRIEMMLVRNHVPGRIPGFLEVRDRVREVYVRSEAPSLRAEALEKLKQRYGYSVLNEHLQGLGNLILRDLGVIARTIHERDAPSLDT